MTGQDWVDATAGLLTLATLLGWFGLTQSGRYGGPGGRQDATSGPGPCLTMVRLACVA
jgi:hypothetical protein